MASRPSITGITLSITIRSGRTAGASCRHCLAAVGLDHVEAERRQEVDQQGPVGVDIVDHQHCLRACRGSRSPAPVARHGLGSRLRHAVGSSRSNQKRLPAPARLSTWMSPPIRRTSWRLIARPSPVPPKRRCTSPPCSKGWKMASSCVGANADAAVADLEAQAHRAGIGAQRPHLQAHLAAFGELDGVAQQVEQHLAQALLVDAEPPAASSGAPSKSNRRPFSSALNRMMSAIARRNSARSTGAGCSSILPASILDRSRMSLISVSRCSPLCWMIVHAARLRSCSGCVGLAGSARSRGSR